MIAIDTTSRYGTVAQLRDRYRRMYEPTHGALKSMSLNLISSENRATLVLGFASAGQARKMTAEIAFDPGETTVASLASRWH
ncbi:MULTISPECIES: hypothetical protein [Microvirga]|uniref:hypothetical protein n=1 Tax=Microvirga TaxID=186650 RepID=UPI0021C6F1EA|nr:MULTISPECIES: hypothetical protein [unclassified Microvirga]